MTDFTASIRELALVLGLTDLGEHDPIGTQIEKVLAHARVVVSRIRTLTAERDQIRQGVDQALEAIGQALDIPATDRLLPAALCARARNLQIQVREFRGQRDDLTIELRAKTEEIDRVKAGVWQPGEAPNPAVRFIRDADDPIRLITPTGNPGLDAFVHQIADTLGWPWQECVESAKVIEGVQQGRAAELRLAEIEASYRKPGVWAKPKEPSTPPEDLDETWRKRYSDLNETHNRAAQHLYATAEALGFTIGREVTSIEEGARRIRNRAVHLAEETHKGELADALDRLAEGLDIEVKDQEPLFVLVDRITEHLGVGDDPELPEDVRQAIAFLLFVASRMANSHTYEEPITIFGGPELRARVALDELLARIDRSSGAPEDDEVLQEIVEAVALLEVHTGTIQRWCPEDLLPASRRPVEETNHVSTGVTGDAVPPGSMWPKEGPGAGAAFTRSGLPSQETVQELEAQIAAGVAEGLQPLGPKAPVDPGSTAADPAGPDTP